MIATSVNIFKLSVPPMLAQLAQSAPTHGYAYEAKWDGIRALAYVAKKRIRLLTRNDIDTTAAYPELVALSENFPAKNAILDGEIVALKADGVPDFELLQNRMHVRDIVAATALSRTVPVTYLIFDLLYLNGSSLLDSTYLERRKRLLALNLTGPSWATPPHVVGDSQAFIESTRQLGLEGVIAKRLDSFYSPGKRSDAWLKIKHVLKQEFVIAGWQDGNGARQGVPGALLLGYYDSTPAEARRRKRPQKLVYAGKVGTGFSFDGLLDIQSRLKRNATDVNPFEIDPPRERKIHFARPELVAEVRFGSWTRSHMLRHASFQGLRDDKPPAEVVREG